MNLIFILDDELHVDPFDCSTSHCPLWCTFSWFRQAEILQLISAYLVLVALTTVSRRLSSGHLDAGPGGQSWGGGGGGCVWIASGGELQTQICRVSCAVRSHLGAVHLTECKMMRRRWMSWRWDSRAGGRSYWGVIPDDKCPVWIIVMDGE